MTHRMRQGCRTERAPRGIIWTVGDVARFVLSDRSTISPYALSINPPTSDPIALMAAKPIVAMPGREKLQRKRPEWSLERVSADENAGQQAL